MKRNWIWFLILAMITAIALTFADSFSQQIAQHPATVQAQQQPPSPALPEAPTDPQNSPSPTPEASPSPSPSPEASPSPTPEESPAPTPEASPSPTPEESPSPETLESLPATVPLAETPYTDTAIGYQIGIVEEYEPISLAGVTSIASPDGTIAYTVTARPRAVDSPLNEASLAQVAIEAFARGEGFTTGVFEPALDGVKIPWTGSLTQGRNTQALSGFILSRQVSGKILVLLVAATEEASEQVDSVFATVSPTLEAIN